MRLEDKIMQQQTVTMKTPTIIQRLNGSSEIVMAVQTARFGQDNATSNCLTKNIDDKKHDSGSSKNE
jgi:hypothetical protein